MNLKNYKFALNTELEKYLGSIVEGTRILAVALL
jgi:hypothetical protein